MNGKDKHVIVSHYSSPCGVLRLGAYGDKLCLCDWSDAGHRAVVERRLCRYFSAVFHGGHSEVLDEACRQLDEYFEGNRRTFSVPLLPVGTDFQLRVWNELNNIGSGEVITYSGLAMRLGCPASVRAVANAVGANALSIFLPCHRVVGTDGSLTGYAGGIDAKRYLLALEKASVRSL